MLGFLVRRCAQAIGHEPNAGEFAAWANNYREHPEERARYLFGRPITVEEAEVVMRHPSRAVSTRLSPPPNPVLPDDFVPSDRVVPLAVVRRRAQNQE